MRETRFKYQHISRCLFLGIMALCAAVTLLIPVTSGKTLDQIESSVLYGIADEHQDGSSFSVTDSLAIEGMHKTTLDATSKA